MATPRPTMVGLASATSANGTARNGAELNMDTVHPGILCAVVGCTIVTGSVVATFSCQGSMDGTTWYDLKSSSNTANTTFAATGTAALVVTPGAWAFPLFRVTATLSGAATAAGDLTVVNYQYVPKNKLGTWS